MAACLFVCTSVIRNSNQWAVHRFPIFRGQDPFCLPWLPQAVCKLLQEHQHSCLPWGWEWGMDSCYCAKSWNWLKLTAIYHPRLSLEIASLQQIPEFQVHQRDSANCCLHGEMDSWCSLLHYLPRILCQWTESSMLNNMLILMCSISQCSQEKENQ